MNNKQILSALAMDLKRVALALYRQSNNTAKRFSDEALERIRETDKNGLPLYMQKIVNNITAEIYMTKERTAEDVLMYSVIVQNYVLTL